MSTQVDNHFVPTEPQPPPQQETSMEPPSVASSPPPPPVVMATPVKHTPTPIQTYQPPSTPSTRPAAVSTISEEQRKYAHSILRVLKRQPEAKPFLLPVDIAGLGLVDYLDKVPIPMDISTVEKKLTGRVYASVQEFTADVTLIWNNCYAYNGPESPYSLRAKVLEGLFSRHITRMPGVGVDTLTSPVSPSFASPTHEDSGAARSSRKKKPPRYLEGMVGEDEGSPPKRRHVKNQLDVVQLKYCSSVLRELMKKEHQPYAFPFYNPVDARIVPDYHTIVQEPMDLSTIRKKLERADYDTASELEQDIRLMFNNCYRYNPVGDPVHNMGRQLERVFDQKWADMPTQVPPGAFSAGRGRKPQVKTLAHQLLQGIPEGVNGNVVGVFNERLQELLNKLQDDIISPAKIKRKNDDDDMEPTPHKPGKRRKDKTKYEPILELTTEQKEQLSQKIEELEPPKLKRIMTIIARSMPDLQPDSDEIEIDMDRLDNRTLSEIYRIAFTPTSSIRNKKRPSKKEMDQMERERQLVEAQQKLAQFKAAEAASTNGNGVTAVTSPPPPPEPTTSVNVEHEEEEDDDSSSSGSSSDGSESDAQDE